MKGLWSILMVASLAMTAQARAQTSQPTAQTPQPTALLQQRTAELKLLMAKPTNQARKHELRALVGLLLDYGELSRRSLKGSWEKRSPKEQSEFQGLLKALIEKSYVRQIEGQPNFSVKWTRESISKSGERARVFSLASSAQTTVEIEYRLLKRDNTWVAADVVIDGVSMVKNYRRSFRKIIKKDGWEGLLGRMKTKLAEK